MLNKWMVTEDVTNEQGDTCESFEENAAVLNLLIGEFNDRFTDFEKPDIRLKLAIQSHLVDITKVSKELHMEVIEL